jgi:peptidoglycan/LPS O-acetylase OafA/YrhL
MQKQMFFVGYSILLPYLVFYIAYIPGGRIRNFNKAGDYSYGIYIYAFPVQQSIAELIPNISVFGMVCLSFIITFILAYFSWHFVEKKFLKMKRTSVVLEKMLQNLRLAIPSTHTR